MRSNLKALGLALFALLALGAVAAQGASAANHKFMSPVEKTIITAEQDPNEEGKAGIQTFTANGNPITCHKFHADGTQVGKEVETLELLPQYSECDNFASEFPVRVTNNGNTKLSKDKEATEGGCKYVFHGETSSNSATKEGENQVQDAPVDIKCETGKEIEIEIFGEEKEGEPKELICTIGVGEKHETNTVNQGLHGVKYSNQHTTGKPEEVTADAKVHNIKYTSEGGLCFLFVPETGEDATYEGKATVRGFEDNGEGETGEQVNATITNP